MKNYYDKNAQVYINNTIDCDMSEHYNYFLQYMPNKGKILDIGFGSGRDFRYFLTLGYDVYGIDTSKIFVKKMKEHNYKVYRKSVERIKYSNEFIGIWACASLIHVKRNNLAKVLKKCLIALEDNGVMYFSFKYGNKEIKKDGRYFNYINEEILFDLQKELDFKILKYYISSDVRIDRSEEKWLNVIITKIVGG